MSAMMFAQHEELQPSRLKASSAFVGEHQQPQLDAVIIRNLTYEAGMGRNRKQILNKINLTVPEGSIYGLLGPSGCGKTTMLRCVVGRIRPRAGSVLVFGFRPGQGQGGEVPGRDVGYMPQEISIYEDFTIGETLKYFGKINRMGEAEIGRRISFLLEFLDLPGKSRLVVNLSGGQKRRVSLAAALVHSPPLLILDEPTVGVDPLLRQSIWRHLVTLTKTERISVIITTHYIEEARQANVVGLMRHGRILAEASPDELMRVHQLTSLEDVFLKLCVTDSARRAATLASTSGDRPATSSATGTNDAQSQPPTGSKSNTPGWDSIKRRQRIDTLTKTGKHLEANLMTRPTSTGSSDSALGGGAAAGANSTVSGGLQKRSRRRRRPGTSTVHIHAGGGYSNQTVEDFSSEVDDEFDNDEGRDGRYEDDHDDHDHDHYRGYDSKSRTGNPSNKEFIKMRHSDNYRTLNQPSPEQNVDSSSHSTADTGSPSLELTADDYVALQAMKWAARRSNALNFMNIRLGTRAGPSRAIQHSRNLPGNGQPPGGVGDWFKTLMAVAWKNYVRLKRNPPVLVFQFMLPAIQVILFCLCIGGEPFDVPVAVVNDEQVPRASRQFLDGLDRKVMTQIPYDNLTSAMDAVRRGQVWGAIYIPDRYTENLRSRLILGEDVNNETLSNGTIRVYPDLTNLHLALALENTFRTTFMSFARNSLEEMGYDKSLAELPIQLGRPVYGSLKKNGYLEFMAPGVVISISYVMATGLTALAFILERRDGLLERSLVSGVGTAQILLAHAINQVFVMSIQIFLVLGCTFFVFEIPSRGPFVWVVLLILLQGCTGMGFGLLVSAVCKEENTAVMMLVGTFYTNLILAGIIWPIEAMPHWLRPLSYAQPQTLPTDSLRHILSRGWGITETGVLLGFAVTIGWLVIFLLTAGAIFKYSS